MNFKKLLSMLLLASMLLTPVAMMEEAADPLPGVIEEAIWAEAAANPDNATEPDSEDADATEEIVDIETVDAIATEDTELEFDTPAFEAHAYVDLPGDEDEGTALLFGAQAADGIAIDKTNFPDDTFRGFVSDSYDNNPKDGYLFDSEIQSVKQIFCGGMENLIGLEYFTNLEYLYISESKLKVLDLSKCSATLSKVTVVIAPDLTSIELCNRNALNTLEVVNSPKLTSLDISDCPVLEYLYVNGCGLKELDVSKDTKLKLLWCGYNDLSELDLRNNTALESLQCGGNHLTSLDVRNNTKLNSLSCGSNPLKSLDVSNNTALFYLDCTDNHLPSLDVKTNTELDTLRCGGNDLSELDLSSNIKLRILECGHNEIKSLDISKNTKLESLNCEHNHIETLDVSKNIELEKLCCVHNNIATLDISSLALIAPYVNDEYKQKEDGEAVCYKWSYEDIWEGIYYRTLGVDKKTRVITIAEAPLVEEPNPVPVSAPAPVPASAPAIPTIASIKKSSKTTVTAAPGTVYQLDLGGTTGKKFKSSKKKVATVDGNGLVTVKAAGKTKITFKVGKKKRTVTLTVKDPTIPGSVTLSQSGTVAVKVGETTSLTAAIPEGTNSGIKWKSSNKKVAAVDQNGNVTFKKAGKVTITATATRGKKKAKVKFKVSK